MPLRTAVLDHKTQSEVFAYGLVHGLVPIADVVSWADCLLTETANPEEWLLDLSTFTGGSEKELLSLLHCVPGSCDVQAANQGMLELLSKARCRPFGLFHRDVLPSEFAYPVRFVSLAQSGKYLYNPAIEFLDANAEYALDILRYVGDVSSAYVPFAKGDDEFYCFDANSPDRIVIVDIVDHSSTNLSDFESWLQEYENEAHSFQRYPVA